MELVGTLLPLEKELKSWEEDKTPRIKSGVKLIASAKVLLKARRAVSRESYFEDSKGPEDKISTQYDEILGLVSGEGLAPPTSIKVELSHIRSCLAEIKYLPIIEKKVRVCT